MVRGLLITMQGQELRDQITERIHAREAKAKILDERIEKREGDASFDVRIDDGFETLGELEAEREHHRTRIAELTIIRDHLNPGEKYTLNRWDLRAADLMSAAARDSDDASHDDAASDDRQGVTVDGLKLTFHGEQIQKLLQERIHTHNERALHWKREQARTPEEQTDEEPLLPDHICENEAERHEWRADVLGFLRDHLDPGAIYRLSEGDLAFAELLPEKPGWLEQDEYEQRTAVGLNLGRLAKNVGRLRSWGRCAVESAD